MAALASRIGANTAIFPLFKPVGINNRKIERKSHDQNPEHKCDRHNSHLLCRLIWRADLTPDLKAVPDGKGWKGSIGATKLIEKDGAAAIEFNKPGQNVVWLDGFEFSAGTIEFDAKGKSGPPQSSFVGVAFHTVDAKTHDAVYFRPFNFRAADPERKSHAVQYVSEPQWPWQRLRQEKPGQFEKPIEPALDGDAWFHAKVIVEKRQVKVFVNGATEPSLVVNELSDPRRFRWPLVQRLRRHCQPEDYAEQMMWSNQRKEEGRMQNEES